MQESPSLYTLEDLLLVCMRLQHAGTYHINAVSAQCDIACCFFLFIAFCNNSLFDLEYLVRLFFIFIILLAFAAPGCNHMKEALDKTNLLLMNHFL